MIEVTYELLPSDVSQLFRYIRHHRNQMRPVFLYAMLSIGILMCVASAGLILLGFYRNAPNVPSSLGIGCLLEFCSVLYLSYSGIIRPQIVERQAQRNPQVVSRKTMRVSPTGVFVRHPLGEVTLHWPLIVDTVDDRDCYYFFLGRANALAVPKRAFNSPDAALAFYNTARQFWQSGKTLATPNQSDVPDVWPPAPRAGDSQELGGTPKH